ncbi:hypothetical protein MYP_3068 [Sporocytophaga myxococcoides]|uniref:Uncharacterized protein n=1 Tax=Sporocytophaga myxococcoides TaxID=153721 RepID=A0A098LHC2_9BACT|nr:hypothetical protein [Sporocytophaga myxococcoides]GAL85839.1 hypothetical protein MYP_3068 [Sporocytophaga myxococcoides]
MKKIILLMFFCLLGTLGFSQAIPEKANTIVITLPDSNGVLDKVKEVFLEKDYTLKAGKGTSKVVTNPKTLKGGKTRVNLIAEIKGAEVWLSGNISIAAQDGMKIEYKGNKGTPIMDAWEELEKVAKAFGKKMKYEVK